jgi:adenine-specific DNA-methyltransferase
MQLNAEDGGNRRWILAQLDEPTAEGSEARKAGYETIDEIARKRIKRAAEKIKHDAGLNGGNLDLGFHHYRVKAPAALTIDKITEFDPSEPAPLIADDMVAEMGGIGVILATWLTADGYPLDRAPEAIDIAGFTAHYIGNSMLYIIEQGWGKEQTKALLNLVGTHKLNLNTIIVYGYSFTLESMRELEINVMQSLNKQVSIEKRY